MIKRLLLTLLFFVFVDAHAQQTLWGDKPIVSPEIHSDNTVTFRMRAPKAVRVQITGDFLPMQHSESAYGKYDVPGIADLKEGKEGVWEYTTPLPLLPELYNYSFIVDGLKTTDPANVYLIRDVATVFNVFIVGGARADLYKVNSVNHGTVSRRWYWSPSLKMNRRLAVYTPAGYEESNKRYHRI